MGTLHLTTSSPEETRQLGKRLGQAARPGDVFLLEGPFGAGKTVLVQGLAEGLDIAGPVASPSFVIVSQHQGRLPLYHVDLYRLEHPEPSLLEALEEYMGDDAVTVVEWSERLPQDLRHGATILRLTPTGETERAITLHTPEQRLAQAVQPTDLSRGST